MKATGECVSGSRVLVSVVAEPRDPWRSEAVRLFRSLRLLGGGLRSARARALFVGGVDAATTAALKELDVDVQVIEAIDVRCPHANKLAMLDQDDDVEWVLALDTDTLVTGDLSNDLKISAVRARVVDADPLRRDQWARLFSHFGLAVPRPNLRTTSTGRRTIRCFNSGALFVPHHCRTTLGASWRHFLEELLIAYERLGDLAEHSYYTDQMALALAISAAAIPVEPLPVDVNTPTHAPINWRWRPRSLQPRLVHYHHRLDPDGRVAASGYPGIDDRIARANSALSLGALEDQC